MFVFEICSTSSCKLFIVMIAFVWHASATGIAQLLSHPLHAGHEHSNSCHFLYLFTVYSPSTYQLRVTFDGLPLGQDTRTIVPTLVSCQQMLYRPKIAEFESKSQSALHCAMQDAADRLSGAVVAPGPVGGAVIGTVAVNVTKDEVPAVGEVTVDVLTVGGIAVEGTAVGVAAMEGATVGVAVVGEVAVGGPTDENSVKTSAEVEDTLGAVVNASELLALWFWYADEFSGEVVAEDLAVV